MTGKPSALLPRFDCLVEGADMGGAEEAGRGCPRSQLVALLDRSRAGRACSPGQRCVVVTFDRLARSAVSKLLLLPFLLRYLVRLLLVYYDFG